MNDFVNELIIGLLKSPIIYIPILIAFIYIIWGVYKRIKSITNVHESHFSNVDSSKNVCPRCGGTLQIRSGKFGKFYGCSNFPRCRYTKKL